MAAAKRTVAVQINFLSRKVLHFSNQVVGELFRRDQQEHAAIGFAGANGTGIGFQTPGLLPVADAHRFRLVFRVCASEDFFPNQSTKTATHILWKLRHSTF